MILKGCYKNSCYMEFLRFKDAFNCRCLILIWISAFAKTTYDQRNFKKNVLNIFQNVSLTKIASTKLVLKRVYIKEVFSYYFTEIRGVKCHGFSKETKEKTCYIKTILHHFIGANRISSKWLNVRKMPFVA